MSKPLSGTSKKKQAMTPMIGALLRLPREAIVARLFEAVNSQGYDISNTELEVFMYPGPDGQRPADLARRCNMTRQAMNYVLLGLERRGYIERHSGTSGLARVVRLTQNGWEVLAQMRMSVAEVEQEWGAYLGAQRFNALKETLRDLSDWLAEPI